LKTNTPIIKLRCRQKDCSTGSPYGKIISNWKIEENQFKWEVIIPANSTATVYIPGNNITEGGLPIEDIIEV